LRLLDPRAPSLLPPRRSSDLTERGHAGDGSGKLIASPILHVFALEPIHHVVAGGISAALSHRADFTEALHVAQVIGIDLFARERDRKSTRLNSSHVKISYAVC